jgi:secreted trypsin-like serine protease
MTTIDNVATARLNGAAMIRRAGPTLVWLLSLCASAPAMVGGAPAGGPATVSTVMIVGSRGNFCTGTAIARDLVLTAAHCVLPGADYKLVEFDAQRQAKLRDVARIERHPQFNVDNYLKARVTADVALLKFAAPLSAVSPATLMSGAFKVAPGDVFIVAGMGLTVRGDGKTGGVARSVSLTTTGQPGTLQIRLFDPKTRGESAGLGACTGDSGAPVFQDISGRLVVIGVVSWSTGPKNEAGCGGLTGVTPLVRYRDWIAETAKKLGSPLTP